MEISILLGALGFFIYNVVLVPFTKKAMGSSYQNPINKYFGEKIDNLKINLSQVYIKPDIYGTLTIQQKEITTFCGENHWQSIRDKHMI